jgi:multidrug efflux pump subunit AcrA (membrane-fusion protein)
MRKRNKNKGKLLVVVLALVAAGIGGGIVLMASGHSETSGSAVTLASYTVARGDYRETVEVSGNVEPLDSVDLSFPVSGRITAIAVEEGQTVTQGQILARLEDSTERYDLAAVDLSIEEEKLSGTSRELQLLQLEREVKAVALEDTRLISPFGGVASEVSVEMGDYVSSGSEVIRVIDGSAMTAEVELDELDVPLVEAGQKVQFFFDAFPELEVTGYLAPLPAEGRVTDQGLAVLDVTLVIDDPPEEIRSGYSFTAEIVIGEEQGILVLDEDAVMDRNGSTIVLLPAATERESPTPQRIEATNLGDGRYRILSGLEEGDTVVATVVSASAKSSDQENSNPLSVLGFEGGPSMGGGPPAGPPPGTGASGSRQGGG